MTTKQLLRNTMWSALAMTAALLLLTCVEVFDLLSQAVEVRVTVSRGAGHESLREPAEVWVDGRRGEAWVNGKRVW